MSVNAIRRRLSAAAMALVTASLMAVAGVAAARDAGAPPTVRKPVSDSVAATTVVDPYRWLENGADPQVQAWSRSQDARTRRHLDALPQRAPIFRRLMAQGAATSPAFYGLHAAGGLVFAYYDKPPSQQPMLALLGASADPAQARVVIDPNTMNAKGTTAIDWFVPSPDGCMLAVSMSENGSEDGTLHLFDVASGKEAGAPIPRVQYATAGGSLAWRADSQGFWYTRYPGADRPADEQHFFQQVYFHRIGDAPAADAYVLGKDFPKVAEIFLTREAAGSRVLVTVANGDGGEFAHYVIDADGSTRQLTRFADRIVAAALADDDSVYLVSRMNAPRGKLLRLKLADAQLDRATVVVPESEAVMLTGGEGASQPLLVTRDAVYVREVLGGPSRVAIYARDGTPRGEIPLPGAVSVDELEALADGTLMLSVAGYLRPAYFLRYDPKSGQAEETALARTSPVRFDDTEVVREFAVSRDGTRVPLTIVRRKGTLANGRNPVLLTGYGGFGVSLSPGFLGSRTRLWLDAGGVYVVANLRGGGEFGETWHSGGALTNKQNVFDDFIAVAEHLIDSKITSPQHLAIQGGSNGGLLMGAVLTQRPELFRAVVSQVGIYDMLRLELDPNGAFNVTEYGSVKDPAQAAALLAYSPYQHVEAGTRYPAILMQTGATDGRVNPAHSRKMIARLQAATVGRPVYLSINDHAGHGIGSAMSIRVGQSADSYAFLFEQLGLRLPPQSGKAAEGAVAH